YHAIHRRSKYKKSIFIGLHVLDRYRTPPPPGVGCGGRAGGVLGETGSGPLSVWLTNSSVPMSSALSLTVPADGVRQYQNQSKPSLPVSESTSPSSNTVAAVSLIDALSPTPATRLPLRAS